MHKLHQILKVKFSLQSAVTCLCFTPNSDQIITVSKDETMRIWNINGIISSVVLFFISCLLTFACHEKFLYSCKLFVFRFDGENMLSFFATISEKICFVRELNLPLL